MSAANRPDYGIDAPGLMRGFFLGGIAALGLAMAAQTWLAPQSVWAWLLLVVPCLAAVYLIFMGCLMLYWSKVIKLHEREQILDHITWHGNEQVLDVGCGRGLMLVAAARRLQNGQATGVDIWQARDQSGNRPESALHNARIENVAGRVKVETGDARALPFGNATFNVVVSHWVVHNLETEADRDKALAEMVRVLCPGGVLLVSDIEHRHAYMATLQNMGMTGCRLLVKSARDGLLRAVSFGSFQPATILATKPL